MTFVVLQGDRTLRDRWDIVKSDFKARTVIIPPSQEGKKKGKTDLVLIAREIGDEKYKAENPLLEFTVKRDSPTVFHGSVGEDYDLSAAYTVAHKLCITLKNKSGQTQELCTELDVGASTQSQVLKQFIMPNYTTENGSALEGKPVKLRAMPTHSIEIIPNIQAFKELNLGDSLEYKLGKIQYQFNRGHGEEIASLMQTYNDYRAEFTKTGIKPQDFHLIDQPTTK
jgi:hypothetical protein